MLAIYRENGETEDDGENEHAGENEDNSANEDEDNGENEDNEGSVEDNQESLHENIEEPVAKDNADFLFLNREDFDDDGEGTNAPRTSTPITTIQARTLPGTIRSTPQRANTLQHLSPAKPDRMFPGTQNFPYTLVGKGTGEEWTTIRHFKIFWVAGIWKHQKREEKLNPEMCTLVEQIPGAIFQGGGLRSTTFVIIYQNVLLGL